MRQAFDIKLRLKRVLKIPGENMQFGSHRTKHCLEKEGIFRKVNGVYLVVTSQIPFNAKIDASRTLPC